MWLQIPGHSWERRWSAAGHLAALQAGALTERRFLWAMLTVRSRGRLRPAQAPALSSLRHLPSGVARSCCPARHLPCPPPRISPVSRSIIGWVC